MNDPRHTDDRVERVAGRLESIRERVGSALVVAVTKGFEPDIVPVAVEAGCTDLGESYAQEFLSKVGQVDPEPRWHFIGRLQRNKVRRIAPYVSLWHSVDRITLANTIAQHAPGASILVQVNATGEEGKGGCAIDGFGDLVEAATAAGLDVEGVMAVGPTDPESSPAAAFEIARRLRDEAGLAHLSMGMSGDLDLAIDHGATIVRVGTALFGSRPVRA